MLGNYMPPNPELLFLKLGRYVGVLPAYMSAPHMCPVLIEVKRRHQIP